MFGEGEFGLLAGFRRGNGLGGLVLETDANLAVGEDLDRLPGRLHTRERRHNAAPQLFIRTDQLHPEAIEFFSEFVDLRIVRIAVLVEAAEVIPDLRRAEALLCR